MAIANSPTRIPSRDIRTLQTTDVRRRALAGRFGRLYARTIRPRIKAPAGRSAAAGARDRGATPSAAPDRVARVVPAAEHVRAREVGLLPGHLGHRRRVRSGL